MRSCPNHLANRLPAASAAAGRQMEEGAPAASGRQVLQEAPAAVGQLMVEEAAAASACRLIGRVWLLPVYLPLCGCCLLTTCVPCCVAAGCWATTTHVCLWCGACWCLEVCGRVRFCYLYFCCGNIWCGGGLQQPTPVIGTGRACVWKCVSCACLLYVLLLW